MSGKNKTASWRVHWRCPVLLLLFFSAATLSQAMSMDFKGSGRFLGTYSHNPDIRLIYPHDYDKFTAGILRLIASGNLTDSATFKINTVHEFNHASSAPSTGLFTTGGRVNSGYRHPDLTWEWSDHTGSIYSTQGVSAIDQAYIKLSHGTVEMELGRQPINLATCFYFTPNDFFQPFSAQAFNRIYKPGVDALRLRYFASELAETGIICAAGYDDREPDWDHSALMGYGQTLLGVFEISGLAGKIDSALVAGGAIQGEIGSFGVRGEGHGYFPTDKDEKNAIHAAAGIDRLWPNTFHLMVEYLFLSDGESDESRYMIHHLNTAGTGVFAGRHYGAVGVSYELHPLVTVSGSVVQNLIDLSASITGTMTWSLADEADMIVGFQLPLGKEPRLTLTDTSIQEISVNSEFGLYPSSAFLEFHCFF